MFLLVVLHHGARGHLLGAAAVAARFLGRLLDVLVLALLLVADSLQVLRLVLLGHGVCLRIGSSSPPPGAAGRRFHGPCAGTAAPAPAGEAVNEGMPAPGTTPAAPVQSRSGTFVTARARSPAPRPPRARPARPRRPAPATSSAPPTVPTSSRAVGDQLDWHSSARSPTRDRPPWSPDTSPGCSWTSR